MLWEEYFSGMFHFGKRPGQNSELSFCFFSFFFFKQTCVWPEQHLWVRQVFLVRAEFMLWVEYLICIGKYALRRIYFGHDSFCKKSMTQFRAWFCFSFFLGGLSFFFFQQGLSLSLSREAFLGQTSVFGQSRIHALSRIFDLYRNYALRRILFGHVSFCKKSIAEFRALFCLNVSVSFFFQTKLEQRSIFGSDKYFWSEQNLYSK